MQFDFELTNQTAASAASKALQTHNQLLFSHVVLQAAANEQFSTWIA